MFFKKKKVEKLAPIVVKTPEFVPQYKFGQVIEGIAINSDVENGRYYVIGTVVKEIEDYVFMLETTEQKHFDNGYVVAVRKDNVCKVQETKGEDING